jgi:hypothetical protein
LIDIRNSFVFSIVIIACFILSAGCSSESRIKGDVSVTLRANDWENYVGDDIGIWVSISGQEFMLIEDYKIIKQYRCSTAKTGAGNKADSGMTPLGWHRISAKVGGELEMGAVLKDREWTGEVWNSEQDTKEDLILSRILRLEGLEEGINRGEDVDTWSRYIYIHGTNQIADLGRPVSAGCVRLSPQDVTELYDMVDEGCPVLITN